MFIHIGKTSLMTAGSRQNIGHQGGGSDVVSVSCFGVRVSVMFHFMFVHYTFISVWLLSGHLLGNSCPLG